MTFSVTTDMPPPPPPLVFALQPTVDYITFHHPCSAKQRLPASRAAAFEEEAASQYRRGAERRALFTSEQALLRAFSWKGFLQTARTPSERPSVSGHINAETPDRRSISASTFTATDQRGSSSNIHQSKPGGHLFLYTRDDHQSCHEELIDSNLPPPEDERPTSKTNQGRSSRSNNTLTHHKNNLFT